MREVPGQRKQPAPNVHEPKRSEGRRALRNKDVGTQEAMLRPSEKGPPKDKPGIGLANRGQAPADTQPKDDKRKGVVAKAPAAPKPYDAKDDPNSYEFLGGKAYEGMGEEERAAAHEVMRDSVESAWCEPGVDNPKTVHYLVTEKKVWPTKFQEYLQEAEAHFKKLDDKGNLARHRSAGMSDLEIKYVMLYTTNFAYAMNAMLRGDVKSERWTKLMGPMVQPILTALGKVPSGARNKQFTQRIDKAKNDNDIITYDKVYRADSWSPQFADYFASEIRAGHTLTEKGFLSTTILQGGYGTKAQIHRTIENAKLSRSVGDISALPNEAEALFTPGNSFKVTRVEMEDEKSKVRTQVDKPEKVLPQRDGSPSAFNKPGIKWHITMKHVGMAKSGSKASRMRDRVLGIRKADA